jgi:hypothetical protein
MFRERLFGQIDTAATGRARLFRKKTPPMAVCLGIALPHL